MFSVWRWVGGGQLVVVVFGFCTRNVCRVHRGVLDIRGRRDFSRFDPSPGEAPLFSNFGPPAERRPFGRMVALVRKGDDATTSERN